MTRPRKKAYTKSLLYEENYFIMKTNLIEKEFALEETKVSRTGDSLDMAMENLKKSNKLNPNLYYIADFLKAVATNYLNDDKSSKIKMSAEELDKYYIHIPFIGWAGEDYLVIKTLKSTKDIVGLDLAKKEELRLASRSRVLTRTNNN